MFSELAERKDRENLRKSENEEETFRFALLDLKHLPDLGFRLKILPSCREEQKVGYSEHIGIRTQATFVIRRQGRS